MRISDWSSDVCSSDLARRRDSLEAALTVVRKLFPQLARSHGLDELHAVVEQCLERLRDEPQVVIRCADADLDALQTRAERPLPAAASRARWSSSTTKRTRAAAGERGVVWLDLGM